MNDGNTYDVPSKEYALVGDFSVSVLTRVKGQLLNKLLGLSDISEIAEIRMSQ